MNQEKSKKDGPKSNFNVWMKRLNDEDMPIMGRTVQKIVRVVENKDSSVAELSKVVLEDISFSAKVLKLANTVFYNPGGRQIGTISRAITQMGLEKVRAISLTVALMESMVRAANREHLMKELARYMHAASQARTLAQAIGDKSPEQIFVAALMYNIGELAFWCFAKQEGDALGSELRRGVPKEQAETKVLGFPISKLTQQLVEDWKINPLLAEALDPNQKKDTRMQLVGMSYDLALAAEKGWKSEAVKDMIEKIALVVDAPLEDIQPLLHEGAREAAQICGSYGVSKVAAIIPDPDGKAGVVEGKEPGPEGEQEAEVLEDLQQYNPKLQLDILREMSSLLNKKPDFNLLLQMTLDGIHRGIGMDRTLLALITPDHQYLTARYALGYKREEMLKCFRFFLASGRPHAFKYLVDHRESLWTSQGNSPALDYINNNLVELLGGRDFFAMPLIVADRPFGLFYADRLPSHRELDQESFENFEYFVQHACQGLDRITQKR